MIDEKKTENAGLNGKMLDDNDLDQVSGGFGVLVNKSKNSTRLGNSNLGKKSAISDDYILMGSDNSDF